MKRRPSAVWKYTPSALTTGSGWRPAWADQSYSVWRRQSSVISSALSDFTASTTTPESYSQACLTTPTGRCYDVYGRSAALCWEEEAHVSCRIRLSRPDEPGRDPDSARGAGRRRQGPRGRPEPDPAPQAAIHAPGAGGRHRPPAGDERHQEAGRTPRG